MIDGEYTIYVLQWQSDRKSKKWGNPDSPFQRETGYYAENWFDCGRDAWGAAIDPTSWKSGVPVYRSPKSHEDLDYVRLHTGRHGWQDAKYALRALKRVRKLDAEGGWDTIDPGFYRKHMQRVRHKFRVVKVQVSQHTQPITENEILEAV